MRMCVYATAGVMIRVFVWSGKCHSKQEVGWSSADIDQLFYITCTLEVRSYVNSTSMEATNQLLATQSLVGIHRVLASHSCVCCFFTSHPYIQSIIRVWCVKFHTR